MKNRLILFLSGLVISPAFGNNSVGSTSEDMVFNFTAFDYLLFISAAAIIFYAGYTILGIFNLWVKLQKESLYAEKGLELETAAPVDDRETIVSKIYKKLTGTVPIEREKEILLSHNYDGIQELDNNLPPWWLYGFYVSIFVAVVYMNYYHFSDRGASSAEIYAQEMEVAKAQAFAFQARQANLVNEKNVEALVGEADLAAGHKIFSTNCIACHLATGGGSATSVGPNLTDEYWLHGGGIKNIFHTVKYGVPEKGMIAWKNQLPISDIHKVASYVLSLQGSNPPGAKEPQGDLYDPSKEEVKEE